MERPSQPPAAGSLESRYEVHSFPATDPRIVQYLEIITNDMEIWFDDFMLDGEDWTGRIETYPSSIMITCHRMRPENWLTFLKAAFARFNIFRGFENHPDWALPVTMEHADKIQKLLEESLAGKNIAVDHATGLRLKPSRCIYAHEGEKPVVLYDLTFGLTISNVSLIAL